MLSTLLLLLLRSVRRKTDITPANTSDILQNGLEKCKRAHEVDHLAPRLSLRCWQTSHKRSCALARIAEEACSVKASFGTLKEVSRSTSRGQQSTAPICSLATCSARRLLNKLHRLRARLLLMAQIKLHHQADLSKATWKLRQSRSVVELGHNAQRGCQVWRLGGSR